MFYSVDGKIIKLENGFPQRKVNTLTFQVSGDRFPVNSSLSFDYSTQYLKVVTNKPEVMTVNWGDGNVSDYVLAERGGGEYIAYINHKQGNIQGNIPNSNFDPYFFQDGNTGTRNITISFSNLESLVELTPNYIQLEGYFPDEIKYATKLENLTVNNPLNLQGLTFNFLNNNLKVLKLIRLNNQQKLYKIPDGIFNLDLEYLSLSDTFSISDNVSSNFFKINQLKESLIFLELTYCDIEELPVEYFELTNLVNTNVAINKLENIDARFNLLTDLETLGLGSQENKILSSYNIPDFNNLKKLKNLAIRFPNKIGSFIFSDIILNWVGLRSLNQIQLFNRFVQDDSQFDEFINSFYTLCTNEANITEDANAFNGEYPHRFRDISWGDASLAFTGTKQAPQGYVQGVSNGTPANEGEKVYVLQNQYGHTITHA